MRRTLLTTALALAAAAAAAAPANATFPGRNGPIAYRTWTFESGLGSMFTARPNGSGARVLTEQPGFFSDWRADGRRIAYTTSSTPTATSRSPRPSPTAATCASSPQA
jgi:TolB protein